MNALREFFTPEAGQRRRSWLNGVDQSAQNKLKYAIGPQAMQTVNSGLALANMLNPVTGVSDAMQGGQKAFDADNWQDRMQGGIQAATGIAATVAPVVAGKIAGHGAGQLADDVIDAFAGWNPTRQAVGDDLGRFAREEDGGIKAFHGSPHDFDKFSMDAIGTGEGAQAYGHGLYFAESEGVARSYRDSLAGRMNPEMRRKLLQGKDHLTAAVRSMREDGMEPDAVMDIMRKSYDEPDDVLAAALQHGDPGSMYEVNINANPDDFLDWDAPLTDQPNVARRLGYRTRTFDEINDEFDIYFNRYGDYDKMPPEIKAKVEDLNDELNLPAGRLTGEQAYSGGDELSHLARTLSGKGYSEWDSAPLRDAGIPGIKYLDQGSRGAGDGSRNFVVFDDKLIEIVRKYGIAAVAPMLGMTQADVEAFQQEYGG